MNTAPTPGELLGEILATRNLQNMAWQVYMHRVQTPNSRMSRDRWSEYTDELKAGMQQLLERMQRDRLAQVTTAGFKARIEYHANSPCVTIYRTTETGEERITD